MAAGVESRQQVPEPAEQEAAAATAVPLWVPEEAFGRPQPVQWGGTFTAQGPEAAPIEQVMHLHARASPRHCCAGPRTLLAPSGCTLLSFFLVR